MSFKIGDKLKVKEKMWTDLDYTRYGFNKDTYQVVSAVFESMYPSVSFVGSAYRYDAAYFELVEEEKVNTKFIVGDKVISTKNTPDVPEGFVGYIFSTDGGVDWDYIVQDRTTARIQYFKEDELELLSFAPKKKEETKSDVIEGYKSALDKQVSGDHYKDCKIQPIEYIFANGLSYLEGNVIKYTTRHSKKNGRKDIEKAIHYLELILEMEYKDKE